MPRNVTPDFVKEMFAQTSDAVLLALLVINHATLSQPIRLVADREPITHNGAEFIAFGFEITLPKEGEGANGVGRITIDNTDLSLMDELRSIQGQLDVELIMVLSARPDVIEEGPIPFKMRQVRWNATSISANLYFDGNSTEPFPWAIANPLTHPSAFA